ncbi:hypothetical protein [Bradyrhizobium yuanmingense]|uniref:hypothetical protein n=1 Tax=Bradyrhizobium yuanmingense TaxID=108015 RepID=UPI000687ADF8|nr:hypothetical protein [Bradyrhizobium yuanmingense]
MFLVVHGRDQAAHFVAVSLGHVRMQQDGSFLLLCQELAKFLLARVNGVRLVLHAGRVVAIHDGLDDTLLARLKLR